MRPRLEERDFQIQECIAKIVIDCEPDVARSYVHRRPAITSEVEKSLRAGGTEGSCVSCQSASNRGHQKVVRRLAELRKALLEDREVKFSDLC
jgi:hypothetical protein